MVPQHAAIPRPAGLSSLLRESPAEILVVDDNAGKRLSITSVLEQLGHSIVEAESGEAALRAVMDRRFAVILMDVQMPVMDGYETARFIRMRGESEHTPIIFITAHAAEESKIPVAYESGAVDFIFAPIVPEILRAKVRIFVELFLKSRALELTVGQIRDSEARTRSVLDNVADGIVTVGVDGVIQSFNRAASALFGYTEEEAIGLAFSTIVGPKYPGDFASHAEANQQLLSPQPRGARAAEPVGRRKDGSLFPMELDLSDVELETGTIHIGCLRDISERQSYTEALQHQALHDNLTGLPNRVLFGDRVTHAIRAALRTGDSLALLVMDLDDFKHVNDTLGHQHGDALLKLVTERLDRVPARRRHGGAARRRRVRDPAGGGHRPGGRRDRRLDDPAGARAVLPRRRSRHRREGEHRHHARPAPRRQRRRSAPARRPRDVRRQARRHRLRAVRDRAGGDARRAASPCSASCASASSVPSWSCTTSRRSTSARARSSASRR